jgi:hypothetical protein
MKILKTEIIEVEVEVKLGNVDIWFNENGPYVAIDFENYAEPDDRDEKVPIGWDKLFETAKDSWVDDDSFDAIVAGLRRTADRLEEWYNSLPEAEEPSVQETAENEQTPTPIVMP